MTSKVEARDTKESLSSSCSPFITGTPSLPLFEGRVHRMPVPASGRTWTASLFSRGRVHILPPFL